ncbi:MAG: hypothetical protein U1E77_05960 [Inhella sp.]
MKPYYRRIVRPSAGSVYALAALACALALPLALGLPLASVLPVGLGLLLMLGALAALDLWRSLRLWRQGGLRVERRLPAAFAIGVSTELRLELINPGPRPWHVQVFDELDPVFDFEGLPQRLRIEAQQRSLLRFRVTARQRGLVCLGQTQPPPAQPRRALRGANVWGEACNCACTRTSPRWPVTLS